MRRHALPIAALVILPIVMCAFAAVLGEGGVSSRNMSDSDISAAKPDAEMQEEDSAIDGKALPDDKGKVYEIVCWGDSLTEGVGASEALIEIDGETVYDASYQSYPEILNRLTGYRTCNFGVSGATSEEIAIMQGGLKNRYDLGEYDAIDTEVMEVSKSHKGTMLVLEIGSNGGWGSDYGTLIAQYDAMIAYSGCKEFMIIGDTDDPGTSFGDENQDTFEEGEGPGETSWEAALREAYGDHFINMRVSLIEHGLEVAGLERTEEDDEAASYGCVSQQLRSDWTHLNSYGYYAEAKAVYDRGVRLGYWPAS